MTSPALGISYYLWRRARWPIFCIALYLLALAAIVRIAPPFSSPYVTIPLLAPLGAAVMFLMAIAQLEPTDLSSIDSGFPRHMRVLPVTNRSLVLWPMLCAGATVVTLYLLTNWLVLAPTGYALPRFLPVAILAYVVWSQAIVWAPAPILFLRVLAYIIATIAVALVGVAAIKLPLSDNVAIACYIALSLLAYPAGVAGLSLARRGDGQQWLRLGGLWRITDLFQRSRRPFRSPITAIIWYECRRNVSLAPIASIGMSLFMLALVLMSSFQDAKMSRVNLVPDSPIEITRPLIGLIALLPTPLFLFAAFSANLGKHDYFTRTSAFPAFAATRPISSANYLLAKFIAVALSVAVTIAFMALAVTVAVVAMSAHDRQTILTVLSIARDTIGIVPLALAVPLFGLVMWRNAATGMFTTLTGRPWVSHTLQYGFLIMFALSGIAGYVVYSHRDLLTVIVPWLPRIVLAIAALKLFTTVALTVKLRRSQMASVALLAIALGIWLATAASVTAALRPMHASLSLLASVIILLLPFNRLAGAPLALDWNRHR